MKLITRREAKEKGLKLYFTGKSCPNGHVAPRFVSNFGCTECLRQSSKKYYQANLESQRERLREYAKRDPAGNALRSRRWYHAAADNRAKVADYKKRWRAANPEHVRVKGRIYAQSRRPGLVMPAWANVEEIERIYRECPPGMTVDHIIPIAGKTVCGLHVENNLQYLTRSENSRKGARWDG